MMVDENTTEEEAKTEAPVEEVITQEASKQEAAAEDGSTEETARPKVIEPQPRTLTDFAELAAVATGTTAPERPEKESSNDPQIDDRGRSYATGRRKDAVARVWIKPGAGNMMINGREISRYFARPTQQMMIKQPFEVAEVFRQHGLRVTTAQAACWNPDGGLRDTAPVCVRCDRI